MSLEGVSGVEGLMPATFLLGVAKMAACSF